MINPKYIKLLRAGGAHALDALYPPSIYCMSCGRPTRPDTLYSMCEDCLSVISWANEKNCIQCGKPLEDWYPDVLCAECNGKSRAFECGITCFQYREKERELLHDFKYRGKSYMSRKLSEMLYDKITAEDISADAIVPVPMYKPKEKKRGYNQAALLARFTAERLGIPCYTDALLRVRDTAPMNKLGAKDRRRNLEGAFLVNPEYAEELKEKHILLADDIYTTGTTAEHCTILLKEAGVRKVTVMSLAAGKNQRELPDVSQYT